MLKYRLIISNECNDNAICSELMSLKFIYLRIRINSLQKKNSLKTYKKRFLDVDL